MAETSKVLNIVHNVLNIRQNRPPKLLKLRPLPPLVVRAIHAVHQLGETGGDRVDLTIAQLSRCPKDAGRSGFRSSSKHRAPACREAEG